MVNIQNKVKTMKIAVAGTGYVRLSIATLLAQHHEVVAVDVIPEKADLINRRQVPMQEQLLPFNRVSRANVDRSSAVDYILEPRPDTLLDLLLPSSIRIILYNALLDSITAENAARVVAMQTATDNAQELTDDLTLEYNKQRQQAITAELADITSSEN